MSRAKALMPLFALTIAGIVTLLAAQPAAAQRVAVLTQTNAGGGSALSSQYQLEAVYGEAVVGHATGTSARTIDFGFWFADKALRDASAVGIESVELPDGIPTTLTLKPNYPNPASHETNLHYGLPTTSNVRITLFDVLGRSIRVIANRDQNAGWHKVRIGTDNLPSGLYFVRLRSDGKHRVQAITVTH